MEKIEYKTNVMFFSLITSDDKRREKSGNSTTNEVQHAKYE